MNRDIDKEDPAKGINNLYRLALESCEKSVKKLIIDLSVRFRVIARLRIRNGDDVEDIIQDALMVVSQKYKDLPDNVNFIAWAHQVLKYQILKYYKKTGSNRRKIKNLADKTDPASNWEPDPMLRDNLLECLRKVNRKNKLYARILNLHFQGFTTGEICAKLKIKANYCYVILLRARSMIEQCLERGDV